MDPLRCGAGEAGAFHPLYEALQTIRAKPVCASFSLDAGRRRSGFGDGGFAGRAAVAQCREYSEELGVELALWAG
jgi:hypothetical protein